MRRSFGTPGLWFGILALFSAGHSFAQPRPPEERGAQVDRRVSHSELLRRVDRSVLTKVHHFDIAMIASIPLGMLLSIDSIEPAAPIDGNTLRVRYTLTNFSLAPARGVVTGRFRADELVRPDGSAPSAIALASGASLSSELLLPAVLSIGSGAVRLSYNDQVTCRTVPGHFGRPIEICTAGVHTAASLVVTVGPDPLKIDSDRDGVADVVEDELLARFRPYYRFSLSRGRDEENRPADPWWFVQRSELFDHQTETGDSPVFKQPDLANDPARILTANTIGSARVDPQARRDISKYYLNLFNGHRSGEPDWNRIVNEATGLFGHVTALRENSPDITGYKVEYWQFYAFNPVPGQIDCYAISDSHEGDWEGVELVVQQDRKAIRYVRHHIHSVSVYFEMAKSQGSDPATAPASGLIEHRGPNAGPIALDVWFSAKMGSDRMHNNLVQFYCNDDGCTHPVVYIEHGGHASWPTSRWSWPGVLNHDGDSPHQYLVKTPPNLGEIGAPNPACPACALVVGFNGNWGACGGDPPEGPPVKWSWGSP